MLLLQMLSKTPEMTSALTDLVESGNFVSDETQSVYKPVPRFMEEKPKTLMCVFAEYERESKVLLFVIRHRQKADPSQASSAQRRAVNRQVKV